MLEPQYLGGKLYFTRSLVFFSIFFCWQNAEASGGFRMGIFSISIGDKGGREFVGMHSMLETVNSAMGAATLGCIPIVSKDGVVFCNNRVLLQVEEI